MNHTYRKKVREMESNQILKGWVEQYGDRLLGIAYSYTRKRAVAEDCLQDALLKAYTKIHQLRDQDNPFPWLVRIVVNQCKLRGRRVKELTLLELPDQFSVGPEQIVELNEITTKMHQAVMMLPEKYRIPIVLHYFEDMQFEDIGAVLGEPSATIRTRVRRARTKLAKILEERDEDGIGRSTKASSIWS